jgi:hypothetical protein
VVGLILALAGGCARPLATARCALPDGDPPVVWAGTTQMVEDPQGARPVGDRVEKPLRTLGKDELRRRVTALLAQTVDYGIKLGPDGPRAKPGDVGRLAATLLSGEAVVVKYDHGRLHPSPVVRYQIDLGRNAIMVSQPGEKVGRRGANVARRVLDIYFAPQTVTPLPVTYDAYCDLKKPWDKGFEQIGREY